LLSNVLVAVRFFLVAVRFFLVAVRFFLVAVRFFLVAVRFYTSSLSRAHLEERKRAHKRGHTRECL